MHRESRLRVSPCWSTTIACLVWLGISPATWGLEKPFEIRIIDADTGRGIPLVELKTTHQMVWVTDNAGRVAFDEPGLLGQRVFFHLKSHGYRIPEDALGMRGLALDTVEGGREVIKLERAMLAERCYRITGQGLYADSIRLGMETPLVSPLGTGQVMGQDSVQNAVLGNDLYWFWGDTNRPSYPLGHFGTAAAKSRLNGNSVLPVDQGIDLTYYEDETGFSRPAFEKKQQGMTWLDGVFVVEDSPEGPVILGHYSIMKSLGERIEHGMARFDPTLGEFVERKVWSDEALLFPRGHGVQVEDEGKMYWVFCSPFPQVRVLADWEHVQQEQHYQALTPLKPGTRFEGAETQIDRDAQGNVIYEWKAGTEPLTAAQEQQLVKLGLLDQSESRWQVRDAKTEEVVLLHSGNVSWNKFKQKYILIAVQQYGAPSFLGEVWYSESDTIEGPWERATKVVTHDKYSFYNPRHHPYFDQDDGRYIYFEGTYTSMFSGNESKTPRYDYNQIMYRLDLADERLELSERKKNESINDVGDNR